MKRLLFTISLLLIFKSYSYSQTTNIVGGNIIDISEVP